MRSSSRYIKFSAALFVIALFIIGGMGMNVKAGPSAQATGSATASTGGATGAGGSTGGTGGMRFPACSATGGTTGGAAGGATMAATTAAGAAAGMQDVTTQFLMWVQAHQPGDMITLTVQRSSMGGAQATSAAGGTTGGATMAATTGAGGAGSAGNQTAFLGIRGAAVADCGVQVLEVFAGSPAETAGMQVGDVIVAADGMALNTLSANMPTAGATMAATTGASSGATMAASTGTGGTSSGIQEIDITVTLGTVPPGVVPSGGTTGGTTGGAAGGTTGGVATMPATP